METDREPAGTTCRSRRNIPAMNRSKYDGPKRIFMPELATNSNKPPTCMSDRRKTSLMVPLKEIRWFEANFRGGSAKGRMYSLLCNQRKDRPTKFELELVWNVEKTGCNAK